MSSTFRWRSWETAGIGLLCGVLVLCAAFKWIPASLVDAFAFATGIVCVWLITKESIWNWPWGLVNNLLIAVINWQNRLFADFGLQWVYFAMGLWGWWEWLHGGRGRTPLPVSSTTRREWFGLAIFLLLGTWGLWELMLHVNGAAPFADSVVTAICLAAQYLICRKRIENWYFWITADLIYIPLYWSRGVPMLSALFTVFLCLCILGLIRWRRELQAQAA